MKKSELKSIIKECVKEILFDEGILSNLVAEVAMGITKAQTLMVETKQAPAPQLRTQNDIEEQNEAKRKKLLETKRKMLDAMGNTKMSNVFEGTAPLKSAGSPASPTAQGPMAGRDANDAGIDISGLFSVAGQKWNALK
tara:strand:+ start:646 stop:1062 length:417 start_codon:yes stop_codon:yes gene_type:complete